MAKAAKKKTPKERATKYEEPVKFNGTFEDMIAISVTGAGARKTPYNGEGKTRTKKDNE